MTATTKMAHDYATAQQAAEAAARGGEVSPYTTEIYAMANDYREASIRTPP